jgi:hypothetical protein
MPRIELLDPSFREVEAFSISSKSTRLSRSSSVLGAGAGFRYGTRHLKRAIGRLLVQPLSNLMASGQIHPAIAIRVSHKSGSVFSCLGVKQKPCKLGEQPVGQHKDRFS